MIHRFLCSLALVLTCFAATPVVAMAFDPFGGACKNGTAKAQQAAACNTNNADPIAGPQGILMDVTRIVSYLAGAIAVIMIMVGAIRFITSGSDVSTGSRTDTDVEDAKRMIGGALIGLAIIILAQAIIGYVIRRL